MIVEANRRGHQIRLVVPAEDDRVEEVGEFGRIYHVSAPKSPLNSNYRIIYPSQYISSHGKLQKIFLSERPDLIEISDKYTLNYLGALLRMGLVETLKYRPLVVGFSQERMDDNLRAYCGKVPFGRTFCSIYMKWLYFPFFDHHIANSEYTAAELRSAARGQLVPRGTWIRPMGVDLRHLSAQRRRPDLRLRLLQNLGAAEDATLLLYAGRLVPEKNLPLLFDLLAHLAKDGQRDYRLVVVGDGIERNSWERKCARDMPGRTLFFGHIQDKNVLADIYANSDIFIHPNPREPFGIAPLEAMASGLPLVAPNAGGVTSYANTENAWIVNADAESFATAVKEAATDRKLTVEKAERGLATAHEFRWEVVAPSFFELYEDLIRSQTTVNSASAEALPPASFCSTPAKGLQAALMRGAAQVARASFQTWSRFAPDMKPRHPNEPANSPGRP